MAEPDDDEVFEAIIEENDMEDWLSKNQAYAVTISDLYEGLAIMSNTQVDLHGYLNKVIAAIFKNNQAGYPVAELPQLSTKQVSHLKQIFESCAIFLEEEGI